MAEKDEHSLQLQTSEGKVGAGDDCQDAELDELLNSALGDFDKPSVAPSSRTKSQGDTTAEKEEETADSSLDTKWTEDFIKQAAAQFEQNMQSLLSNTGNSGDTITPEQLGANFQKMAEATAKVMTEEAPSDAEFSAAISQTLKNLSEGADNLQNPFSEEELMNMFGGLGMGEAPGDGGDFLPIMQQMMQSLLSKEILYPALKEIVDKYPAWLEENQSKLAPEEFERYTKQKNLMTQVCGELENETESDSADTKKQRFDKILELMQKMQDCGQPPQDLVGDLGSVVSFDEQGNPRLPGLAAGADPSQCSLM